MRRGEEVRGEVTWGGGRGEEEEGWNEEKEKEGSRVVIKRQGEE